MPVIINNNQFNLILPLTYNGKDYEVTIGEGAVVRIPIPGEPKEVTKSANKLNKQATRFLSNARFCHVG